MQAQVVAEGILQILPHAQIPLGRHDTGVPQTELDLFEGGVAFVRQFGEGAPPIPRSA